ncbi:MAG: type II toxin-antitoxin system RelE/ParE family toxin [Blastocatellia bacterium]
MFAVKFHEAADLEAAEAIAYYEDSEEGLGSALRVEIEVTVERVIQHPLVYPVVYRSNVRRALTHRFPYSLNFTLEERFILIIAVFHSSRDLIVWKGRID